MDSVDKTSLELFYAYREEQMKNDTREEITIEAGSPDILDSRECTMCNLPMHIHPVVSQYPRPDGSDPGFLTMICPGNAPESIPLPFKVVEFRDEDQLEWYDYLNESPR